MPRSLIENAEMQVSCEILNLESFILFARYIVLPSITSRCLSNPISLLDPAMSRSSFPIRTAETLDQGGRFPSTVSRCYREISLFLLTAQSVRSNIAGNDVDYPPFLMPPLSMFRVIHEIEARHEDETLLILFVYSNSHFDVRSLRTKIIIPTV